MLLLLQFNTCLCAVPNIRSALQNTMLNINTQCMAERAEWYVLKTVKSCVTVNREVVWSKARVSRRWCSMVYGKGKVWGWPGVMLQG